MKLGCMFFVLLAWFAGSATMHAQVSVYGGFSVTHITEGPKGDHFYGPTAGVLIDGPKLFHHVLVSADVTGRFLSYSGARLDSVTVGPRLSFGPVVKKLTPYVAFDVGFGRLNDGLSHSTTDTLFGGSGGIVRPVSSRFDVGVEYKYEYFGANFNQYSPDTLSATLTYHFVKR